MSLKSELQKRVEQLEGRIVSINHLIESLGDKSEWGRKYTKEDVLKAALCGIREWEKEERNFHLLTDE